MNEFKFVEDIRQEIGPISCTVDIVQEDQIYYLVIESKSRLNDVDWDSWGLDAMFDLSVKRRTTYKNRSRTGNRITYELGSLFDFLKDV